MQKLWILDFDPHESDPDALLVQGRGYDETEIRQNAQAYEKRYGDSACEAVVLRELDEARSGSSTTLLSSFLNRRSHRESRGGARAAHLLP
jgi:hypothetical protein